MKKFRIADSICQVKFNMLLPVILGLLLVLPEASWSDNSEAGIDIIFVAETSQGGIYSRVSGKIKEITQNEIVFEAAGKQLLYERAVVRRVMLDESHSDERKKLARTYWNQDKSTIFKALEKIPVIGKYISFLNDYSVPVRTFFAILVLLGLISYATYKSYEIFIIRTNLRDLNFNKLQMEVRKLRYELNEIEEKLGVISKTEPEVSTIEKMESVHFPYNFEVPKLKILDFVKYKIFRIFTEEERKQLTESWLTKWQIHQDSSKIIRLLIYSSRLTLNVLSTFLVGMFSLGCLVDIMLPFIAPADFNPLTGVLFFILFIISFAYFLRLNTKRGIIRATYLEVFKQ